MKTATIFSRLILITAWAIGFSAITANAEIPAGTNGPDTASIFQSNQPTGPRPTKEAPPAMAEIVLPSTKFEKGKSYPLVVKMKISGEFHTNSNTPTNPSLIKTEAVITVSDPSVTVGRIIYPKGAMKKFSFSEDKLSVYEGEELISTTLHFSENAAEKVSVTAVINYQACTDMMCFMPMEAKAEAELETGAGGSAINGDIFAKLEHAGMGGGQMEGLESATGLGLLFLVFIGGLALNLTPCVYPMIPVTIGFFGAAAGRTRAETVLHALIYLLGMAVMYSALGTFAAVTGSLFGEMMQNSLVVMILVLIMIGLSLSMFGFYDIQMPDSLMKLTYKNYGGFFGTFFMGLTVGIIAAPCVGPFVIGLLTFVGEKQDPFLGFILFFILAVGLGLPLVILAVFSGSISSLPKSGVWMEWVKKFFGIVLLGMALYFAQPLIPKGSFEKFGSVLIGAGAVYLIIAGRNIGGKVFQSFRWLVPAGMILFSVFLFNSVAQEKESLSFNKFTHAGYQEAIKSGKPAIVYFTADWCVPCKELKLFTFSDERIIAMRDKIEPLKIDLTKMNDEKKALKKEFNVLGVPTVIIYDADGKEKTRFTGFITADEFLELL